MKAHLAFRLPKPFVMGMFKISLKGRQGDAEK